MLEGWFLWFILFWVIMMVVLLSIGGFFMFRKFLKRLPKEDGRSELDWQDYYIENSRHLWNDENKQFLDELTAPVPELFRDAAKAKIAGKIGELALKEKVAKIDQQLMIKGYILATPKRDHTFLKGICGTKNRFGTLSDPSQIKTFPDKRKGFLIHLNIR